jgi:hypothetical protein
MNNILILLHGSDIAQTIRENELLFPWIEAVHVMAITLVFGSIALVDLRLIGVRGVDRPISKIANELLPITWLAFVLAAVTGAMLFISNALSYSQNLYFLAKIGLLALAGINMLCFQYIIGRDLEAWNHLERLPSSARIAGAISILTWAGVIFCGRLIGFTLEPVLAIS